MRDTIVAELGVVEQTLDTAEVDERAEVLQRDHAAAHDGADDELLARDGGALGVLGLEQRATRHDDVRTGTVLEARDAELELLADELLQVLCSDGAKVDLRHRAEAAHAGDLDLEAALVDGGDETLDGDLVREGVRDLLDGLFAAAATERATQRDAAVLAVDLDDARLDIVADVDGELAVFAAKLDQVDETVALRADVDEG